MSKALKTAIDRRERFDLCVSLALSKAQWLAKENGHASEIYPKDLALFIRAEMKDQGLRLARIARVDISPES